MVTGGLPFDGTTSFEISSAILRDEPEPLPARLPVPLRAIARRCLAKDPGLRYQTAAEVRAALEMVTVDAPKVAKPTRPRTPRATKSRASGASRIRSIAVLPLDNLSRDPEQEYFADGITEALIGAIAQIEGLKVISRTSIIRFKGTGKSVPEITRDLNVDGLLTGSVRRVADRVRIGAQLVDGSRDTQIWSANYDRDIGDILALETEIARVVAREIAMNVGGRHQTAGSSRRTVDPETYSLFLKGRHAWHQLSEPALRKAITCFEQVIARDSSYAPAHAGLIHDRHCTSTRRFGCPPLPLVHPESTAAFHGSGGRAQAGPCGRSALGSCDGQPRVPRLFRARLPSRL
jgi:TolB-like protein